VGGHEGRPSSRHFSTGSFFLRHAPAHFDVENPTMLRDVILWLAGVPIVVIILLHLFGLLH
jgi:hypothetical protein